jgi:uncharacterized protein YdaT
MPWNEKDAKGKTKKATTPAKRKKWAKVANAVLRKTGDEGSAVRIANAAMGDSTVPKRIEKPIDKK